MTQRVCLVTSGHLSTNPRLVKEADALAEAGYDVQVVACRFWPWADAADRAFQDRGWPVSWVRFGPLAPPAASLAQRVRRRVSVAAVGRVGPRPWLAERALHYVIPELGRRAASHPAHLYIAHNLAALPAAAHAAMRNDARLGFDAEDFHRGELEDGDHTAATRAVVQAVEERYIPRCDYVTAASSGIARAYAAALGIPDATTILNVFPLAERSTPVPDSELAREKPRGSYSLFWFSQTIGPNRGLEDAVRALPELEEPVHLSVRGSWSAGYEQALRGLAARLGVAHRVHALAPAPPDQLIPRTAEHDLGLALEPGHTVNSRIALSNKLFTYLLAGLPCAATSTPAQREACALLPGATELYDPGDVAGLVRAVRSLRGSPAARSAAERAGLERFNWDVEKRRFLDVVRSALAAGRRSW